MGSKFVATSEMDKSEVAMKSAMGMDMAFSAEGGGWGYSASVDTSSGYSSSSDSSSVSVSNKASTYTLGSDLPPGDTVLEQLNAWIDMKDLIKKDPQPIGQYTLMDMSKFLKTALGREGDWPHTMIEKISSAFEFALHDKSNPYCEYLVHRGLMDSCAAPAAAKAIQVKKEDRNARKIHETWGRPAMCHDGEVIIGSCGSGGEPDCDGYSHAATCAQYDFKPAGHTWKSDPHWGTYLECDSGAISGICGSGKNQDCNHGKSTHDIQCVQGIDINRDDCKWYDGWNYKETLSCESGYVAVGRCSSGSNKDCDGKVTQLKCCRANTARSHIVIGT